MFLGYPLSIPFILIAPLLIVFHVAQPILYILNIQLHWIQFQFYVIDFINSAFPVRVMILQNGYVSF